MIDFSSVKPDDILRVTDETKEHEIATSVSASMDCASPDLVKVKEVKEKSVIVVAENGTEYEFISDTEGSLKELDITGATKDFPLEARAETTRA